MPTGDHQQTWPQSPYIYSKISLTHGIVAQNTHELLLYLQLMYNAALTSSVPSKLVFNYNVWGAWIFFFIDPPNIIVPVSIIQFSAFRQIAHIKKSA